MEKNRRRNNEERERFFIYDRNGKKKGWRETETEREGGGKKERMRLFTRVIEKRTNGILRPASALKRDNQEQALDFSDRCLIPD